MEVPECGRIERACTGYRSRSAIKSEPLSAERRGVVQRPKRRGGAQNRALSVKSMLYETDFREMNRHRTALEALEEERF
jgi:hypothetical protein